MHTKDILAAALRGANLEKMALKAEAGFYHDFLSPLDLPSKQLADDLAREHTPEARALLRRHLDGEFDASKEESEAWAKSPEGRETFDALMPNRAARRAAGRRKPEAATKPPKEPAGRLALREEGDFWNAYYAMPDTMDGALLLGSLHMKIVTARAERKAAFMDIMRAAVSDLIEDNFGTRPMWPDPPARAPENERKAPQGGNDG